MISWNKEKDDIRNLITTEYWPLWIGLVANKAMKMMKCLEEMGSKVITYLNLISCKFS